MNISKKSLFEGLSYALDLAEGRYLSHSKHVAFTSLKIGKLINLSQEDMNNLYYLSLLHDIGAGPSYELVDHSKSGYEIMKHLGFDEQLSQVIKYHHEFSDGSGYFKLTNDKIPLFSRIIVIANLLDVKISDLNVLANSQLELSIIEKIKDYFMSLGDKVDFQVRDVLIKLLSNPSFLMAYLDSDFESILANESAMIEDQFLSYKNLENFAAVFSKIIDQRNHFTYKHSNGLAELTRQVSEHLAYPDQIKKELYIAALLHDVGKLGVSNDIINKEGRLSSEERYQVEKHTYYTRFVLKQIKGFGRITEWASNHHETLDGQGYPFGLSSDMLDEQSRLLAVLDIYQALTEERPYRTAFTPENALVILKDMAGQGKLDIRLINRIENELLSS